MILNISFINIFNDFRKGNVDPEKEKEGEFKVIMKSLPWTVTQEQIKDLLFGSEVVRVNILEDDQGRPSGEAEVILRTMADAKNALKYHKQLIGHRNVVITESAELSKQSNMLKANKF